MPFDDTALGSLLAPESDWPDEEDPTGPPVVLLHGYVATRAMLRPLARSLARDTGRPVRRLQLSAGFADIRDDALALCDWIEEIAWDSGQTRVDIVGHSMGGLVAAYALKCLDERAWIRRVVTLGTPHRGTLAAAAGSPLLGPVTPAILQMAPSSELLEELRWLEVPPGSSLVSVAGELDWLVPPECARLDERPGQWNAIAWRAGHLDLMRRRDCHRMVTNLLQA
jgi:pimeloyl-ACP methyl ester carboxylesterase